MRLHYIEVKDGNRKIHWPILAFFVVAAYAVVIGSAEVFWYFFTGGFSTLVGLYALVAATLTVIRLVGGALATPTLPYESHLESS